MDLAGQVKELIELHAERERLDRRIRAAERALLKAAHGLHRTAPSIRTAKRPHATARQSADFRRRLIELLVANDAMRVGEIAGALGETYARVATLLYRMEHERLAERLEDGHWALVFERKLELEQEMAHGAS